MCGRYTLTSSELNLSSLGIAQPVANPPSYNIAPGEQVLIVRKNEKNKLEAAQVKWGFAPSWLKDFSRAQINARLETAAEKPMFREAMESKRCLILADGWFDWQRLPDRNQPWYIRPKSSGVFAFAGIWERYVVDSSLSFDSCAVLTREATPALRAMTERMPVAIDAGRGLSWLTSDMSNEELLMQSRESLIGQLSFYQVGRTVNRVANKQPECIKRLSEKSF
jgi:putative SOS response-associated peptidase YedK